MIAKGQPNTLFMFILFRNQQQIKLMFYLLCSLHNQQNLFQFRAILACLSYLTAFSSLMNRKQNQIILKFTNYFLQSLLIQNPILQYQIGLRFHEFYINFMETKTLALLLAVLGAVSVLYNQTKTETTTLTQFQNWKGKYSVKFDSLFEEAYRERIFLENLEKINLHNANEHKTYEMGVNQFSAMTQEEFVQQYLGTIVPAEALTLESTDDVTVSVGDVDWTSQGAVTPVKNQGQCGSCWAFSATGALEALSKLAYGDLRSFSEQQLVDCSGSYGNQACNGGLMDNAFKFVRDHGILLESQYPYKAVKQACAQNSGPFKISGFTDIKNCNDLATGLVARPISVAVDATNWSGYKSGVFNNCATRLNHGVLLVGVTDQSWKVKNSWGATWGESGFIRLSKGNTCGICNVASYPNK